ncbi:Tip elongation aberrant protein 1 [Zancudomyces culisetae]|uniref:Tip elongation aberrant protein 1 n=1 Tax=Zancudomyces culisetae TaxID=1213189 RepID=A0A1R1PKL8_ZANCU|nr:Tip elongation aberrant protein 1 [Zancudomyces culisetae]|eukprot:OMH81510.1 Tip elongation aberrant protein 1 [Zancudomyces culisetae]
MWMFDTSTAKWEEIHVKGQVPPARYGHAAVIVEDTMYIIGGRRLTGEPIMDFIAFKIKSKLWFTFPEQGLKWPQKIIDPELAIIDRQIVMLLGEETHSMFTLDTRKIKIMDTDDNRIGDRKIQLTSGGRYSSKGSMSSLSEKRTPTEHQKGLTLTSIFSGEGQAAKRNDSMLMDGNTGSVKLNTNSFDASSGDNTLRIQLRNKNSSSNYSLNGRFRTDEGKISEGFPNLNEASGEDYFTSARSNLAASHSTETTSSHTQDAHYRQQIQSMRLELENVRAALAENVAAAAEKVNSAEKERVTALSEAIYLKIKYEAIASKNVKLLGSVNQLRINELEAQLAHKSRENETLKTQLDKRILQADDALEKAKLSGQELETYKKLNTEFLTQLENATEQLAAIKKSEKLRASEALNALEISNARVDRLNDKVIELEETNEQLCSQLVTVRYLYQNERVINDSVKKQLVLKEQECSTLKSQLALITPLQSLQSLQSSEGSAINQRHMNIDTLYEKMSDPNNEQSDGNHLLKAAYLTSMHSIESYKAALFELRNQLSDSDKKTLRIEMTNSAQEKLLANIQTRLEAFLDVIESSSGSSGGNGRNGNSDSGPPLSEDNSCSNGTNTLLNNIIDVLKTNIIGFEKEIDQIREYYTTG